MPRAPKEDLQRKALKFVIDVGSEYDSMISSRRGKWLDWYKLYRLFYTEQKQPWQSKLFIPKVFEIIEKTLPTLIAHDPRYIITPRFNENIPFIGVLRDYLNWVWDEGEMREKIEAFTKNMLIYGTSVGKLGWNEVTKMEKSEEPIIDAETGEMQVQIIEEEVTRMEHPTFDVIDIFDFKTDPRVEKLEDSDANIHVRTGVSKEELLADSDLYFNLDKVKELKKSGDFGDISERKEKKQSSGISLDIGDTVDENKLLVKECWCRFSPSGDPKDTEEYVITTVNDQVVIRLEKNDLGTRPFVAAKDKIVPGEFYGIGEVEPLEDLQIELNTLRNQRMDFTNTILNPEWLVHSSSGINPSQLVHRPNNIIITDDMQGIQMLQKSGVPIAGYNEEAQILRDFQTVSQTTDVTDLGGARGFDNTATGVRARTQQQRVASNSIIKHLEKAIADIGRKFLTLAKANIDSPIQIRRPDTTRPDKVKFTEISPEIFEDSDVGFMVKVESGSTLEDSLQDKANKAVALGNAAVQYAQAGVPVDLTKVFTEILKKNFLIESPEDFLVQQQPQPGQVSEEGVEQTANPSGFTPENTQLQPTLPA